MPELPEVETTRRALAPLVEKQQLLTLSIFQPSFRWPIDKTLEQSLAGQTLQSCQRRGKYLLFYFDHGVLLVHLGMSGSVRAVPKDSILLKHDHVQWEFNSICLRLHDPRRFGAVIWHSYDTGPIESHPLLKNLGVEPFSEHFTVEHLYTGLRQKNKAIKTALLDGDIVVGVGNIYASESLFLAKINPKTKSNRISKTRAKRLHEAIIATLNKALTSGGSTLKDFVNPQGEVGSYFEIHANVYNRVGQACHECGNPIKKITQNQRATYYCPKCQR